MFTNPICHWASEGGVAPLLNFNPGEVGPDTQPFPASSAAMTALGLPAPVTIYRMEDAFGAGTVADAVGSASLTPAGNFTTGKKAVGIFDGTSFANKLACEMDYNNGGTKASASGNTVHDYGAGDSFAFFFIFRTFHNLSNLNLFGKQNGASGNGYSLWFTPNSLIYRYDGGAQVDSQVTTDQIFGYSWHYGLAVCNRSTDFMQLYTDLGNGTRQDISAIGSPSNAITFAIGDGILNSNACQIAYMALWEGANAIDIDTNWAATYEDIMWRHPNCTGVDQELTTQLHNNTLTTVIGEDSDGVLVGEWSDNPGAGNDQFPWAYNDGFSHAGKLGVQCQETKTQILDDSDNFLAAGWSASNMNRLYNWSSDINDCPNGMKLAQRLQATAANAYVNNSRACAALTEYTFDFFVKRHSTESSDVAGALIAYDNTGGAQIAIQTFTATDVWQRISLTFTTPAGCVSMGYRIRIDTNGENLSAWRCTARAGLLSTPIYEQNAAFRGVASATNFQIAGVAGAYMKGDQGEIQCHYICDGDDDSARRYVFSGNPSNNRRLIRIGTTEPLEILYYDNTGGYVRIDQSGASPDQSLEHVVKARWDSGQLPSGNYTEVDLDGAVTAGAGAAWPNFSGDLNVDNHIGQNYTTINQIDGIIDYVKVFERPQ